MVKTNGAPLAPSLPVEEALRDKVHEIEIPNKPEAPITYHLPKSLERWKDVGRGSFAAVFHYEDKEFSGLDLAIKTFQVDQLPDFGISKSFTPNQSSLYQSQDCGNVFWRAPELIRGEGGGRRADVWSLGLLVYRMATGNHLFDCERPQLALAIKDLKPEDIDLELRDCDTARDLTRLVKLCLKQEPEDRPYSFDLIKDDMFSHQRGLD
eukprot:sb/3470316/